MTDVFTETPGEAACAGFHGSRCTHLPSSGSRPPLAASAHEIAHSTNPDSAIEIREIFTIPGRWQMKCRAAPAQSGRNPCGEPFVFYGGRNCLRLLQLVFRQVIAERALADAHHVGGLFLDSAGTVESPPDGFLLDPFDVGPQLERRQRARLSPRDAQH